MVHDAWCMRYDDASYRMLDVECMAHDEGSLGDSIIWPGGSIIWSGGVIKVA